MGEVPERQFPVFRPARRNGETTVSNQRRCHSESGRGGRKCIPGKLRIIVGMEIDNPRRENQTIGINLFATLSKILPE